jgi:NAD(P)-dependent dehydrogenase (short-subunit alcohol dehydrogenase family)
MTITANATTISNKRIVLLGGTSGIGLATAQAAIAAGASVVVVSSRRQRVDDAVGILGKQAEGYTVDLSDDASVQELFEGIGPFDHLVYTAGDSLQLGLLADTDLNTIRKAFDVRFFGAVTAVKHAAPYLRSGGSVILTGGVASQRPQKGWTAVASICGAMEALTRTLAVELAPIRVNLVSPGLVRTALWDDMPEAEREAMYANYGGALPVGRVGEVEDIAASYLHLMSNRYCTGQTIVVDGGGVLV